MLEFWRETGASLRLLLKYSFRRFREARHYFHFSSQLGQRTKFGGDSTRDFS